MCPSSVRGKIMGLAAVVAAAVAAAAAAAVAAVRQNSWIRRSIVWFANAENSGSKLLLSQCSAQVALSSFGNFPYICVLLVFFCTTFFLS